MTATLSAHDRTVIDRDTRCRSIETTTPPMSSAQLDQNRDSVVLPLRSADINVDWWQGDKMVSRPSALTELDAG